MNYTLTESIMNALGSSLGYAIVLYIFAGNREKIENNNIITSFKGIPIALIVAGIMALIFSRFTI
jgi:electron transport complex protein RnfA